MPSIKSQHCSPSLAVLGSDRADLYASERVALSPFTGCTRFSTRVSGVCAALAREPAKHSQNWRKQIAGGGHCTSVRTSQDCREGRQRQHSVRYPCFAAQKSAWWTEAAPARLRPRLCAQTIRCTKRIGSMESVLQIGPSVHALRHSWSHQAGQQYSPFHSSSQTADQQLWLPVSFPMPPAERPTSLPASLFQYDASTSSDSTALPQIRGPGARLERINEFHDESSEYDTDSSSVDGRESLFSESSEGTQSMPVMPLPSSESLEALDMLDIEQGAPSGSPLSEAIWTASAKQAACILYHPVLLALATESLSQLAIQAVIADQVFVLRQLTLMLGGVKELTMGMRAIEELQSKLQAMIKLQAEPSQGAQAIAGALTQSSSSASSFAQSVAAALAVLKVRAWASSNLVKAWEGKSDSVFYKYVAAYSSTDIQDAVSSLELYLDTITSSASVADVGAIKQAFLATLDLELGLLTATQALYDKTLQPSTAPFVSNPSAVPVVFATDFDVTCTLEDSSETLMHLAAETAGKQAERQCREKGANEEQCALAWEEAAMGVRMRWDHVLERYSKNLQTVISEVLRSPGSAKLNPPTLDVTLPGSSSYGSTSSMQSQTMEAPPSIQVELPSPSASSCASESPRSLKQAASQPDLSSFASSGPLMIPRSPSEPSDLGRRLKAPSRAFDIDEGAAQPSFEIASRPFNPDGLRVALDRLGELEHLTNSEVEAARVLEGATAEEIYAASAQNVKVRPFVGALLARVQRETCQPVHALSANWAADLIKGALAASLSPAGGDPRGLLVHSNNLVFDARGVSTGKMKRAVVAASDKLRVIEGLMAGTFASDPAFQSQEQSLSTRNGEKRPFTVYLGDGITDLLALLSADLGIVVGQSLSLRKICAAYGVKLQPLVTASVAMSRSRDKGDEIWSGRWSGVFYETSGWEEVQACIFGSVQA